MSETKLVNQQPKQPVIIDKKPIVMELEPGTYLWCSCGYSSNQPFGAHKELNSNQLNLRLLKKNLLLFVSVNTPIPLHFVIKVTKISKRQLDLRHYSELLLSEVQNAGLKII